jgi:hypothetical protein
MPGRRASHDLRALRRALIRHVTRRHTSRRGLRRKTRAGYVLPLVESVLDERQTPRVPHHHRAQFCADETTMLETAERFLGSALSATDAVIACVTGRTCSSYVNA